MSDLVWKKIQLVGDVGKLEPRWERSCTVCQKLSSGQGNNSSVHRMPIIFALIESNGCLLIFYRIYILWHLCSYLSLNDRRFVVSMLLVWGNLSSSRIYDHSPDSVRVTGRVFISLPSGMHSPSVNDRISRRSPFSVRVACHRLGWILHLSGT